MRNIKIKRGEQKINTNEYLKESERSTRTINLSWRNSIETNRLNRKINKWVNKLKPIAIFLFIVWLLCVSIWTLWKLNQQEIDLKKIELWVKTAGAFNYEEIIETPKKNSVAVEKKNEQQIDSKITAEIKPVTIEKKKKVSVVAKVLPTEKNSWKLNPNIQIRKDNLFICMEVKKLHDINSDEYRCAAYMSMIQYLETNNCKTWIAKSLNNCYWIKLPTDKEWLKWEWSVWDKATHIKFETYEQSKYAFAYYYMNYHSERTVDNFVERWVGWNNTNYKATLNNNYKLAYNEYKNLLK